MDTFECPLCLENFPIEEGRTYSCLCSTCLSCLEDTKNIIQERDGNYNCLQCKQPYRKEAIPLPLEGKVSSVQKKWMTHYIKWKQSLIGLDQYKDSCSYFLYDLYLEVDMLLSIPVIRELINYYKEKESIYLYYTNLDDKIFGTFLKLNHSEDYLNELLYQLIKPVSIILQIRTNIRLFKKSNEGWSDSYRIDFGKNIYSSSSAGIIRFDEIDWIFTSQGLQKNNTQKSDYNYSLICDLDLYYYHKKQCLYKISFDPLPSSCEYVYKNVVYQEGDNVYAIYFKDKKRHCSLLTPDRFFTFIPDEPKFSFCNKKLYTWKQSKNINMLNLYIKNEFNVLEKKIIFGKIDDYFNFYDDYYIKFIGNYCIEVFFYKNKN